MAYQFIHVESYARELKTTTDKTTGKKEKAKGRTVRDIIAEAGREPGNCPHIDQERLEAPEVLYGYKLDVLEKLVHRWAENSKDGGGQKLRKNGACLLAGVVSLPAEAGPEAWADFKVDAMKWLKKEYGDSLRSVIEHKDEAHPHLHFYAVPEVGKQFHSLHKGIEARTKARAEGLKTGEQNLAYCEAMRAWQDKFSKEVGQKHGLTRLGPARRRLTRQQWQSEQRQAKALQRAQKHARALQKSAEKKAKEVTQQAEEKAKKTASFGASLGELVRGAVGEYHQPTKEAQEALAQAQKQNEQELEKLRTQVTKSEDAHSYVLETARKLRKQLDYVTKNYGAYIRQQEDKKQREARAPEQRTQTPKAQASAPEQRPTENEITTRKGLRF